MFFYKKNLVVLIFFIIFVKEIYMEYKFTIKKLWKHNPNSL